ncbi:MAG: hypothetical protein GY710_14240 [Desulfobacteraceae bacterium]|nr:hypothetical protein [Desulfobacteraceae bacterium]
MVVGVYVHPKVERQLAALEKQAKNPSIVADRARRIIDALIRGMRLTSAGRLKRKIDKRLKNCLKFDLGQGFRLLGIKEGAIICILFVGDHDRCDNWLDNYSKKKPPLAQFEMHSCTVGKKCVSISKDPIPMMESLEDSCFCQVSQKDLRRVFKGLTQRGGWVSCRSSTK